MSMGQNPLARRFGNIFFVASAVFVVVAIVRALVYTHLDIEPVFAFVVSGFLLFCAYEVWAFTHGRTTSIDSRRHEATPDRTGRRVFGLVLDLAFWCLCVVLLKSW